MRLENKLQKQLRYIPMRELINTKQELEELFDWKITQKSTDFMQYARSVNELCASIGIYRTEIKRRNDIEFLGSLGYGLNNENNKDLETKEY